MTIEKRINRFLRSITGATDMSNIQLIGGSVNNSNGIMTTTNKSNCINVIFSSCNKSTNEGACINQLEMCDSSKNTGGCNNKYIPPTLGNMTIDACEKNPIIIYCSNVSIDTCDD